MSALEEKTVEPSAAAKPRTSAGIFDGLGSKLNPMNWFSSKKVRVSLDSRGSLSLLQRIE
jgi:hypothetical protein